ncbi:MAG: hypothetical protein JOZ17_11445 [Acetobacteraceae bacterium]|nr:hypothetical protein [Acetobacteraceae bacterium]
MPTYDHYFEDGRVVTLRAYPDEFLPQFRKHVREVQIPGRAVSYFRKRDPKAVGYLAAFPQGERR